MNEQPQPRKRGRKAQYDGPTTRDTAYLLESDHAQICKLGDGSFSRGVQALINFYREQHDVKRQLQAV